MRNYTKKIRLAAVMVAPLLLACGSDSTGGEVVGPPAGGCAANEALTTNAKGQFECHALPTGAVTLMPCTANTGAVTSDGTNILCDTLNTVDATTQTLLDQLTDIEKKIEDYGTAIVGLQNGGGLQTNYVGLTKDPVTMAPKPVTGNITFTDAKGVNYSGIAAASQRCVESYGAKAHMCTVYEIYFSVALQKAPIDATTDIGGGTPLDPGGGGNPATPDTLSGGWVYMQSGRFDATKFTPLEPTAGLADNCGGYTNDGTGATMWAGTLFNYTANVAGVHVPKFYGNAACSKSYPIACCK